MSPHRMVVFGGTFDPPQRAHVALPREAARRLECTKLLYVPTSANPLKVAQPTPAVHRLAMLRLALRDVPEAEISLMELERPAPAYTVDTLLALRTRFGPATRMRLLMGSDAALSFPQWHRPQAILDLATPAVMLRPPDTRERFGAAMRRLHDPLQADFWMRCLIDVPMLDVSATEVRRRIASGEPVGDLLSPEVERYIAANGLYGRPSPPDGSPGDACGEDGSAR